MELGFPVLLVNPRMVEVRGERVPDVNLHVLQEAVFALLVVKPGRMTAFADSKWTSSARRAGNWRGASEPRFRASRRPADSSNYYTFAYNPDVRVRCVR
jgi:hypothetical protein